MDEPDAKRARTKQNGVSIRKQAMPNDGDEVLDLALTFGCEPGLRLEVEWDVVDGNKTDSNDDGETGNKATTTTRWWGATLLPYDGRVTVDSEVVRTLEYDAYPEGGFPEKIKEDVVFIGQYTLCDPYTQEIMAFRLEGGEDMWFSGDRTDLEDTVDTCLASAMEKHKDLWDKLTPARQAEIASMLSSHKEKFVDLLSTHTVITPEVIKDSITKAQYDAATK
jgi:hypothetical protein